MMLKQDVPEVPTSVDLRSDEIPAGQNTSEGTSPDPGADPDLEPGERSS